jgi:hypothetical protein
VVEILEDGAQGYIIAMDIRQNCIAHEQLDFYEDTGSSQRSGHMVLRQVAAARGGRAHGPAGNRAQATQYSRSAKPTLLGRVYCTAEPLGIA